MKYRKEIKVVSKYYSENKRRTFPLWTEVIKRIPSALKTGKQFPLEIKFRYTWTTKSLKQTNAHNS